MAGSSNLYARLRPFFPERLDELAVEASGPGGAALRYSWRDLELGSARIARLFADLALPAGARVLTRVDASAEATMLALAALRAGLVAVPLPPASPADEVERVVADAAPALIVCAPRDFPWISRLAFARGTRWVLTLGDDRSGSLLDRAAQMDDAFAAVDRAADDVAVLRYAAGRGPGTPLTHGQLYAGAARLPRPHEALLTPFA